MLPGLPADFSPRSQHFGNGFACGEGVVDYRIEVDKPAFEESLRHGFERGIHLPVQLDLVIQGTEDVRDGFLLGERGESGFIHLER